MQNKILYLTMTMIMKSQKISEIVQSRVVWGGDETIKEIRSIPLNPLAREIVFPNNFHLLSLKAINSSFESNLTSIIKGFTMILLLINKPAHHQN